jgi:hypothetical protein
MAQQPYMTLRIEATEEARELIEELRAAKEALSEERIRAIVREEISAYFAMMRPMLHAPGLLEGFEVK